MIRLTYKDDDARGHVDMDTLVHEVATNCTIVGVRCYYDNSVATLEIPNKCVPELLNWLQKQISMVDVSVLMHMACHEDEDFLFNSEEYYKVYNTAGYSQLMLDITHQEYFNAR